MIEIYWNGKLVDKFADGSCTLKTSTYFVIAIGGSNQVMFVGAGIADSWGIMIRNVRL